MQGQRRTQLCVTATTTAIFAGCACGYASASETHTLKHGETVETLARRYHVPIKDILSANHIQASDILRDGRKMRIPDPPRRTFAAHTMQREARIKKDRISVRIGPGAHKHRVGLFDVGTKLLVTAEQDGWFQVTLDDGRTGWVRQDYVAFNRDGSPRKLAKNGPKQKKGHSPLHLPIALADNRDRKRAQRARSGPAVKIARKHHEETHPHSDVAARKRKHEAKLAHARWQHHQEEIARAYHRHHAAEIAARHHAAEVAARHHKHHSEETFARRHSHAQEVAAHHRRHHPQDTAAAHRRRHLEELARARHRHHLAEIAAAHRRHTDQHHHHTQVASSHQQSTGHYGHRYRPEAESPTASADVVRAAYAYRGTPYRWGQSRPGGFDCSGFTRYVYGRKGVSLPRTAAEQFHAGRPVGHSSMKPGDLVFFHTTRGGISHVGMYVGNGKFVHSSSRRNGGVRVDRLDSGYYSKAFRGARRVQDNRNEGSGE